MSDEKKPSVTARRPISREEYVRTLEQTPDKTAVIPAVTDDVIVEPEPVIEDELLVGSDDNGAAAVEEQAVATAIEPEKPTKSTKAPKSKKNKKTEPEPAVEPDDEPASNKKAEPISQAEPEPETDRTLVAPIQPVDAPIASTQPIQPTQSNSKAGRQRITRVDPWSVTKMSFVVSVALMVVLVVAATVFWFILQVTGVWGALNDSVTNVLSDGSSEFQVTNYLGLGRLVGFTLIVSALNVVFLTALATIGAHAYNLAATFMGGFEVTFTDRD